MIEPVEIRQRLRIVLVRLELVDQRELPIDQRAVATGEGDEHVGHSLAERLELLTRHILESRLHCRERPGEITDLVGPSIANRRHRWQLSICARISQRLDQGGELLL